MSALQEGELCITGSQLMLGYHADHERTEAPLSSIRVCLALRLLYRTGDIGYEDGLMYLKGRIDGLVNQGLWIHPDEVSKAIDTIEGVDVSAVVPFGSQSERYMHFCTLTQRRR